MRKRCVIVGGADIRNYDFIRETPEFEAIAAKLAPYAGDWSKRE